MEKVINWKLIWNCNRFYIQYELDVNMATIHKLIQDKYVSTYTSRSLVAECFGLCRCISIRGLENYTRGYNYDCENKRILLLFLFTCNKYPSHRAVINYITYSGVVVDGTAVEKLDKKFLDDSITYLEGNLSFDEIETPEDINNITDIILYLWKKK